MIIVNMTEADHRGFTIVELLIATTVFSVVLLGALSGFLQIGHLFYKGVSSTNTQGVANQVIQDISGNFQTNGNFSRVPAVGTQVMPVGDEGNNSPSYAYYCVGNTRYTYNINHELDITVAANHKAPGDGGNFGLLKDILPGSSGCATPCDDDTGATLTCPHGAVRFKSPIEMLGDKMRLSEFEIAPSTSTSNFYNVTLVVDYGEDDALVNKDDPANVKCDPNSGIEHFCSVSRMDTSVYKGFSL